MKEHGVQPKLEEPADRRCHGQGSCVPRPRGKDGVRAHVRRKGLDDGCRQRDGGGELDGRLYIVMRGSSLIVT